MLQHLDSALQMLMQIQLPVLMLMHSMVSTNGQDMECSPHMELCPQPVMDADLIISLERGQPSLMEQEWLFTQELPLVS